MPFQLSTYDNAHTRGAKYNVNVLFKKNETKKIVKKNRIAYFGDVVCWTVNNIIV